MADVDDFDFVLSHAVIDDVGKPAEEKGADLKVLQLAISVRHFAQGINPLLHERFSRLCGLRTSLVQIIKYRLTVGKSARRISNFHMPWRLSAAATASSETNSPRSASARPS